MTTVWISRRPDEDVAAELAQGRGPLAGLRLAVKDNVDAAGLPTTAGCPEFAYLPERDAAAVAALRAAGAVVVGKTNLDQFATGLVGTRSPTAPCPTVADPSSSAAGRARDRPSRWLPARPTSRSAPIPQARDVSRRDCRASSVSSPPSAWSAPPAWCRRANLMTASRFSRRTWMSRTAPWL